MRAESWSSPLTRDQYRAIYDVARPDSGQILALRSKRWVEHLGKTRQGRESVSEFCEVAESVVFNEHILEVVGGQLAAVLWRPGFRCGEEFTGVSTIRFSGPAAGRLWQALEIPERPFRLLLGLLRFLEPTVAEHIEECASRGVLDVVQPASDSKPRFSPASGSLRSAQMPLTSGNPLALVPLRSGRGTPSRPHIGQNGSFASRCRVLAGSSLAS